MADNPVSKVCAIVDYLFANECENVKMAREERGNASSNKNADITRIPGPPAGGVLSVTAVKIVSVRRKRRCKFPPFLR